MPDRNQERDNTLSSNLWNYIPVIIVTIWVVWLFLILVQGSGIKIVGSGAYNFEQAAKFGDSFGSLSGLMASLAAAGAWYAVHLQRRDFRVRESNALDEIAVANKRNFESNFFQLLRHLSDIVNNTDISSSEIIADILSRSPKIYVGKDAFGNLLSILRDQIGWRQNPDDDIDDEKIEITYQFFYERQKDELGHYFRFLYHTCNYVISSKDIDQKFYMKLLFAQLSNSELILLSYNCAYGRGRDKFRKIFIDFEGLSNISFDIDIENEARAIRAKYPEFNFN